MPNSVLPANGESDFDVAVVGSGFGASVLAYRLAEAGWTVVVLERGKPYPPGSFPRQPVDMRTNFWNPTHGLLGLFDVHSFRGLEALTAAGLGGGSLIYANVLLRKDERWFVDDQPDGTTAPWPISLTDLDQYYELAEDVLGATLYPFDVAPYNETAKTKAMASAAKARGMAWDLVPLAVSFANNGETARPGVHLDDPLTNIHGAQRRTCRLCGECDIGCNDGAKNTLDHTYLSRAAMHGADVRTLCEVTTIRPSVNGFQVVCTHHHDHRQSTPAHTSTITARKLVIGAGTFGSTQLLLRNRAAFPGMNQRLLGTKFCGNGDLLGFAMSSSTRLDPASAPVITSAIRLPDEEDGQANGVRGAYIQDAGFPQFVSWLVEGTQIAPTAKRAAVFAARRLWHRLRKTNRSELSAEIAGLMGAAKLSSHSMPLLGMGRDIPDGKMSLRDGQLDVDWTTATSLAYFGRVRQAMREISTELGAEFQDNPLWWFKRVITVHPLGGCPMGADPASGVVDQWGEVYGVPGLYIVDGSAMPGPVGANPSLTIAAFAERAARHVLESADAKPSHRSATSQPATSQPATSQSS